MACIYIVISSNLALSYLLIQISYQLDKCAKWNLPVNFLGILWSLTIKLPEASKTIFEVDTSSSQAKGTNSTSFLMCVRNEVELVPLACEDVVTYDQRLLGSSWGNLMIRD